MEKFKKSKSIMDGASSEGAGSEGESSGMKPGAGGKPQHYGKDGKYGSGASPGGFRKSNSITDAANSEGDGDSLTDGTESGIIIIRDKKPSVTAAQIAAAKQALKTNGYPESGFLSIVQKADNEKIGVYGTFDLRTGEPITDITDGYFVSFQVNKVVGERREYTPEEYDQYVYEGMTRTGSMPYLGSFGNPEISFNASDINISIQMAEDFNQESIYDAAKGATIKNTKRNRDTNPTED